MDELIMMAKKEIAEAEKRWNKFVTFIEIFSVIAILCLVTLGALHYEHNMLSPQNKIKIES